MGEPQGVSRIERKMKILGKKEKDKERKTIFVKLNTLYHKYFSSLALLMKMMIGRDRKRSFWQQARNYHLQSTAE